MTWSTARRGDAFSRLIGGGIDRCEMLSAREIIVFSALR